jgi:hypothetical protein
MAQVSNMAGKLDAQSFCSAAIRMAVGSKAAILSSVRRKSATPLAVSGRRARDRAGVKVEGGRMTKPYHTSLTMVEQEEAVCK